MYKDLFSSAYKYLCQLEMSDYSEILHMLHLLCKHRYIIPSIILQLVQELFRYLNNHHKFYQSQNDMEYLLNDLNIQLEYVVMVNCRILFLYSHTLTSRLDKCINLLVM